MRQLRVTVQKDNFGYQITACGKDDNYFCEVRYDKDDDTYTVREQNKAFKTISDNHSNSLIYLNKLMPVNDFSCFMARQYIGGDLSRNTKEIFVFIRTEKGFVLFDKLKSKIIYFCSTSENTYKVEKTVSMTEKTVNIIQDSFSTGADVFGIAPMSEEEIEDSISGYKDAQSIYRDEIIEKKRKAITEIYNKMSQEGKKPEEIRIYIAYVLSEKPENIVLPCDKGSK